MKKRENNDRGLTLFIHRGKGVISVGTKTSVYFDKATKMQGVKFEKVHFDY